MSEKSYAILRDRGVISIAGEDARDFMQGIVSADIHKVAPDRAVYSAFLTPQGKYLHDFFIAEHGGALLLDCERPRLDDLKRRLGLYKLRAKAEIADISDDYAVAVAFGDGALDALGLPAKAGATKPFAGGVAFADPRLPEAGARLILPMAEAGSALAEAGLAAGDEEAYDRLRITLGLPDGSRDLPVERAILLENGFDELNGVDWEKGCYMGQELTARTKYRALIRKRLLPVEIEGPLPEPGAEVMAGDKKAGEMRSARDGIGLALLKLECVQGDAPLTAGEATLRPFTPSWIRLPAPEEADA